MDDRTDCPTCDGRGFIDGSGVICGTCHGLGERLPDWEACEAAVDAGTATALERFIYNNEPGGSAQEREFRSGLAAVLVEAMNREVARAR
jgi:DnaJ-class molecular chaperone